MMQTLTLIQPDDMHLHVRDGEALNAVVPFTARQMGRAIIMPNLTPPISTPDMALAYRQRIQAAIPKDDDFTPLMTLYLTDKTTPDLVFAAKKMGIVAFKLYPAGATTNSAAGVTNLPALTDTLRTMAECDLPLLVHGEVTDKNIDIFDREAVFIERVLKPLMHRLPELRIVFEHITTAEAAQTVCSAGENLVASVTPQHLLFNRNDLLVGGIKPHFYCLPIIKREKHRQALIEAVIGQHAHRFFLGTDSAPHAQHTKECACGCAGIFSAHAAIELYAEAFDAVGALEKLEAFASQNGARFYRLPENKKHIRLIKKTQTIPTHFSYGEHQLIPLRAGETVMWTLQED